jgi:AcrR family transcriptional regulator
MAAKLRVSRGSFCWHFRDIADFRAQLLRSWQERSTEQVIRDLDARKAEPDRLKNFMKRVFAARRDLDRAVRSWAADDEEAARIVAAVDARRVAYIAKMLVGASVESKQALGRAAFLYWAYLGQPIVMDSRHSSIPNRPSRISASCLKSEWRSQSGIDVKKILLALWRNAKNSCNALAIMAETTTSMGDLPAAAAGNIWSGTSTGSLRSLETRFG